MWPETRDPFARALGLTLFVGVLAAVNYRGVAVGAQFSSVFAVAKLLPLALFIGVGLFFVGPATAPRFAAATPGAWLEAGLVLIFPFGGFEAALMPMGAAQGPGHGAPLAPFPHPLICPLLPSPLLPT